MRPQPHVSPRTGMLRRLTGRVSNTLPAVFGRSFTQKTRPAMRKPGWLCFLTGALAVLSACPLVRGQERSHSRHAREVITQEVDENKRVTLHGNTRPEATAANDQGKVSNDTLIEHMLLQLKRSLDHEQALEQFLTELQTKGSPNYHPWLTAADFGTRFGVPEKDLDKLTRWREKHGSTRKVGSPAGRVIESPGTQG